MTLAPIIPAILGAIFVLTAVWNLYFDRQLSQWLVEWGLSPKWRFGVAAVELLAAALLLASSGTVLTGMLLTPLILLSSIGICLFQRAYGRLLLSIPMLAVVIYWYSQLFPGVS